MQDPTGPRGLLRPPKHRGQVSQTRTLDGLGSAIRSQRPTGGKFHCYLKVWVQPVGGLGKGSGARRANPSSPLGPELPTAQVLGEWKVWEKARISLTAST